MKKSSLLLIIIIALYIFSRLPMLYSFPHYFADENYYHQLSLNIAKGDWSIYGLKFIHMEHPFLYFKIVSIFVNQHLLSARLFVVTICLINLILLYIIINKLFNTRIALITAITYVVMPINFYLNRVNFPQNLFVTFILFTLLYTVYNKPILAYMFALLATLTQYFGVLLIIPLYLTFNFKRWPEVLGLIIYIIGMFTYMAKTFSTHTWTMLINTYARIPTFTILFGIIIFITSWYFYKYHYHKLFPINIKVSPWFWLGLFFYLSFFYLIVPNMNIYKSFKIGIDFFSIGIVGLLLKNENRKIILSFFLPFLAFLIILNRSDHLSIIIHPFIVLGFALLITKLIDITPKFKWVVRVGIIIIFIITAFKVVGYMYYDYEDLNTIPDVAGTVNGLNLNNGLVLTINKFSPYLNSKTSDLMLPIAYDYDHFAYRHLPDKSIFTQNVSIHNAKYIIMSPGVREVWTAAGYGHINTIISGWTLVYELNHTTTSPTENELGKPKIGIYLVYENPKNV